VIGCGGDRDRTKRPVMGRLAAELSDIAIFTSDNPRSEPPLQIVEDMLAGLPLDTDPIVELNRSLAIKRGIDLLAASDVLVILGKGHERFQEIEGVSHPFSDREVAEGWIKQGADRHD
jgi:UDP-N-acetylmuramoyl-L-alanyl-D-glutamate--2,6-diaminopimelate ligase